MDGNFGQDYLSLYLRTNRSYYSLRTAHLRSHRFGTWNTGILSHTTKKNFKKAVLPTSRVSNLQYLAKLSVNYVLLYESYFEFANA